MHWAARSLLVAALVIGILTKLHTLPTIDIISVSTTQSISMKELLNLDTGNKFNINNLEKLADGKLIGPESFVLDPNSPGNYLTGTADGKIVKVNQNGDVVVLSNTAGRPLGIHAVPSGSVFGDAKVLVTDALHGLLSIDDKGKITVLANEAAGNPIRYANDLDVDMDTGIIYFTDCSEIPPIYDVLLQQWSTMRAALFDIFSGYPSGRLLKYDIRTGETTVLLSDVAYANGVALSKDKSFLLVAETARYAIRKYYLEGPQEGTWEYILEGLPLLPDGISTNNDGTFWLSGFFRTPIVDKLHRIPWLKKVLLSIFMEKLFLLSPNYGIVLQINEQGNIIQSIHDSRGLIPNISSVSMHNNTLFLGGLERTHLALYHLPQ